MSARKALRYNVNITLVVIRILAMPFKSKSLIGSYVWSDFRMTLKWKRTNKTEKQTNGDRAIWLVLSNGYKHAWLLVGLVNARAKKLLARELSSNQPILRFDIILQQDWPIEQWLLYIRAWGDTSSLHCKYPGELHTIPYNFIIRNCMELFWP